MLPFLKKNQFFKILVILIGPIRFFFDLRCYTFQKCNCDSCLELSGFLNHSVLKRTHFEGNYLANAKRWSASRKPMWAYIGSIVRIWPRVTLNGDTEGSNLHRSAACRPISHNNLCMLFGGDICRSAPQTNHVLLADRLNDLVRI
jgi:hypothetical protein